MTDTTAVPAPAPTDDDRSMRGIINYVQDNSGYELGAEVPVIQTIFWMPPGHPARPSAFTDGLGNPAPIRTNSKWPGSEFDTVIFIFEDPFEFRLYTLPIPDAGTVVPPNALLTPRRFVLSKAAWAYSVSIMSFDAWRDLIVEDVKQAAGEDDDDNDDNEAPDDEPTGAAAGPGAAAAHARTV